MKISALFREHPESVGETYFQHLQVALTFSLRMAIGSVVCLVHAILPFAFERTGSQILDKMHRQMVSQRRVNTETQAAANASPS